MMRVNNSDHGHLCTCPIHQRQQGRPTPREPEWRREKGVHDQLLYLSIMSSADNQRVTLGDFGDIGYGYSHLERESREEPLGVVASRGGSGKEETGGHLALLCVRIANGPCCS